MLYHVSQITAWVLILHQKMPQSPAYYILSQKIFFKPCIQLIWCELLHCLSKRKCVCVCVCVCVSNKTLITGQVFKIWCQNAINGNANNMCTQSTQHTDLNIPNSTSRIQMGSSADYYLLS